MKNLVLIGAIAAAGIVGAFVGNNFGPGAPTAQAETAVGGTLVAAPAPGVKKDCGPCGPKGDDKQIGLTMAAAPGTDKKEICGPCPDKKNKDKQIGLTMAAAPGGAKKEACGPCGDCPGKKDETKQILSASNPTSNN